MKYTHRWRATIIGIVAGALGAPTALAQVLHDRCRDDQLTDPQGTARNEWARKCNYINEDDYAYLERKNYYVVFSDQNAPTSADAECTYGLAILGNCMVGCYHPHTPVLFDEDIPIASAAHSMTRVTSLGRASSAEQLTFDLQEIEGFTRGPTKKPLYWIRTADGRSLGVTHDHPMVLGSGLIVPARHVALQDELLTVDGPSSVLSVNIVPYEGEVWNVQPLTEDKIANVHVANGLLTGSIRFQNQWASESFRLWQRARLDVSDL